MAYTVRSTRISPSASPSDFTRALSLDFSGALPLDFSVLVLGLLRCIDLRGADTLNGGFIFDAQNELFLHAEVIFRIDAHLQELNLRRGSNNEVDVSPGKRYDDAAHILHSAGSQQRSIEDRPMLSAGSRPNSGVCTALEKPCAQDDKRKDQDETRLRGPRQPLRSRQ